MTDLVERLRAIQHGTAEAVFSFDIALSLMGESADEIERLRALLADCERALEAFTVESEP